MANDEPPERDMKEFEFIQLCKFRVLPSAGEKPVQRGKLLACSSQCGLLIYVTQEGFRCVKTSHLMSIDEGQGKERNKVIIEDIPIEVNLDLSAQVLWMDVSGDGLYLAVVVKEMGQLSILFYDIRSFADKNSAPVPFAKAGVNGTPNIAINDLSWNPAVFSMLAVCTSDGVVKLIDVADSPKVIATLPAATGASCFCWSPKGKQLLVGKKDGSLAQYDHSLTEKKQWPSPSVLNGPHGVVDIVWQSTYVFMAAYLPSGAQPSDQPVVILTSSNKENKTTYINFEDVCFGNGEERKAQYFFHLVLKWEMILMASSNATETTVVGKNLDDKATWEHWNLEDCSRAELPLTADQNDSFPIGMVVDYSPQKEVVLSESKRLPPCPVMYLMSTDGMLLGYHLSYTHKDATPITAPAQMFNPAGARKGVPELAPGQTAHTPKLQPPQPSQVTIPPVATSAPVKSQPQGPTSGASSASTSIAAGQNATQQAFGGFSTPGLSTTGPSFQFSALGSAGQTAPGGSLSQKPQALFQTSTPVSQPGSQLSFGGKTSVSSAFSFSGVSTSTQNPSSVFVAPPAGHSKPFSQIQPVALGLETDHPKPVVTEQLSGSAAPQPGVSPSDGAPAGIKTNLQNLGAGTQSTSIFGFSQPRATTPSAFTSRPTPQGQGQLGQTLQTSQTPGNGLVLNSGLPRGNSAFLSSAPVPEPVQPRAPKPAPSQSPQIRSPNPPGVQPSTSLESQKSIEATVDSAFTQNIIEEMVDFEKELKELKIRSRRDVKTVGTRDEMYSLRQDTEKMVNFCKEIKEATKEQLREMQDQKTLCFNHLAMAEDCKAWQNRNFDPHYHSLLEKKLDPASAEQLKALKQMAQALEQNVVELDRVLDAQWQEHQSQKRLEEKLHTPTGDTIYKAIKNNHIVIASQRRQLERVEEQLRNLKLNDSNKSTPSFSLFNGEKAATPNIMKKAEDTLNSSIDKGMTPEKISRLKDWLSNRKVKTIKSTPPGNLSMSRIIALTPAKSPATPSTTKQEQQQLQQRKHGLSQQQQTPTGPPRAQYVQQPGELRFQRAPGTIGHAQPEVLNQQLEAQAQRNLVPQAKTQSASIGQQRTVTRAPTSFSGVAYFKQPSPVGAVTKPTVMLGSGPKPETMVSQNITNTNPVQSQPYSNLPVSSLPGGYPQGLQQHLYEDITPTETEEDIDDDDDYEDEDNDYEEDEEEDEEEAGFPGMAPENQNQVGSTSVSAFGSIGTGGSGAFSFTSPGTSSGGLFKLGQTSVPVGSNPQAPTQDQDTTRSGSTGFNFNAPKLGVVSTTSVLSFSKTTSPSSVSDSGQPSFGSSAAASGGNLPSVASQKPEGSTAFSFGGTAQFSQRLNIPSSTTGSVPVFGSMATPSKSVGFGDFGGKANEAGQQNKGTVSSSTGFNFTSVGSSTATSTVGSVFGSSSSVTPVISNTPVTQTSAASQGTPKQINTVDSTSGRSPAAVSGTNAPASTIPTSSSHDTPSGQGLSFGRTASTSGIVTSAPPTSVFGNGSTPTTTSKTSPVGSTTLSSTLPTSSTVVSASPVSTAPPLFGGIAASAATTLFGGTSNVSTLPLFGVNVTPSSTSLFGSSTTSTSLFGAGTTAATSSPFGGNTGSTPSVFGGTTTQTTVASTPSVFGGTTTQTTASSAAGSTSTGVSVFGGGSSSTPAPAFGSASTTTASGTTSASVFGSATATIASSTAPAQLFGSSTTTTASSTAPATLFGDATTASSTTPAPLFGSTTTTAASSAAPATLFGSVTTTAATSTTPASLFGSATTTAASSPAPATLFGSAATTTASSTTPAPLFGSATTTPASSTTSAPLFGSATTTSSTPAFGFGTSSASTSSGGLFGSSASTTTSGGSVFGGGGGTLFGSSSATTTPAAGGTGLFGSGSSTAFDSSTTTSQQGSVFGQPSTSSGFGFGQQASSTTTTTPFGQTSTFGQAPASSSSGLFGFGGLGGKPSEEKAKQNVFGTPQVFGGTTSQSSTLFGSGGRSTFGGTETSSSFGTASSSVGGFSAGSGGVASSGFGVASPGQAAGGFGAAPAFGSAPSFGSSAAFGSKPAGFGGSPAFGGTPAFGSSPSFSSPSGSTSTFGSANGGFSSFASAAAPSFGQLAQSSPSTSAFGGGGFGATQQNQSSPFGGGFGSSSQPSFGGGSVFGQGSASPGFGGGQTQGQGFGNSSSFGSNPAFSSYRG